MPVETSGSSEKNAGLLGRSDRRLNIRRYSITGELAVSPEVVDELRHAVFEEGAPVSDLRKRFNPALNPRPEGAEELDAIRRTTATVRRLERSIEDIEGLRRTTVRGALDALEALREELTELLERRKAQFAKTG